MLHKLSLLLGEVLSFGCSKMPGRPLTEDKLYYRLMLVFPCALQVMCITLVPFNSATAIFQQAQLAVLGIPKRTGSADGHAPGAGTELCSWQNRVS